MDLKHLQQAIDLAQEKMEAGEGGPFGALIVKEGRVIAEGWNRVTSINDPTAHAEVVAIRNACQALNTFSLAGCEIYSSCEPCPMCLSAILWARLDALYYAGSRSQAAEAGFDDSYFYEQVSLPEEKRDLPTASDLSEEAEHVFSLWKRKEDRIEY